MNEMMIFIVYLLRLRSEIARLGDKLLTLIGYDRRFHSSKGQDKWIIGRVHQGRLGGYFVEVGAGDGRTHSNTFVLERDYGWTGIVIEADPTAASKIGRYRRCKAICACIDSTSHHTKFFRFGHLGGIIAEDTDNSPKIRGRLLRLHSRNTIDVETRPLEAILESNGAPQIIDYLSIDVEGAEYRILSTFPFDRYSFEAITIERPTAPNHGILVRAGYVLSHVYRHDGFYLSAKKAANCGIKEQHFIGAKRKEF